MAAEPFGVQTGYATSTTVKVLGVSLFPDPITIVAANGASAVITLSELGLDSADGNKPRAGYTGGVVLTGLIPDATQGWKAFQNGNILSGNTDTAPAFNSNFSKYFVTCEGNNFNGSKNNESMWSVFKAQDASGLYFRNTGILHADDHDYIDFNQVDDGTGAYAVTGIPHQTGKVYDYALGALAPFGIYSSEGNAYCTYGQDPDRIWGKRNKNKVPQLGDHDRGANDMGWQIDPKAGFGLTQNTNAKLVWEATMGHLQPPLTTGAAALGNNTWMYNEGCLKIGALDGISQGTGDGTVVPMAAPTDIYSIPQIDDFLTNINIEVQPFFLNLLEHSIKRMDSGTSGNSGLSQNAINLRITEYRRLFTELGNSPQSLMDNPYTNGLFGAMACLHGDFHVAHIIAHGAAAYTDNAAENWTSLCAATMNEQSASAINNDIVKGYVFDGSEVKFIDKTATYWGIRVDVHAALPLKEVHFHFLNKDGNDALEPEILIEKRGGNFMHVLKTNLVVLDSNGSTSGLG